MSHGARNYLWVVLLVVLLMAAPVVFGVVALLWLIYWYRLGGKQKNAQLMANLRGVKTSTLLLAGALMLLTLTVHSTVGEATTFGFPTTVMTYHNFPSEPSLSTSWRTIISRLGINPLQAVVNLGIYLLVLLALDRFWQSRFRM